MKYLLLLTVVLLAGCNVQDIPPAHIGWAFEISTLGDSAGFNGPLLNPGSRKLGYYDQLRLIQCTESTTRETFESPTKNGVEFSADVYSRFRANCDDEKATHWVFRNIQPNPRAALWAQEEQKEDAKAAGEAAAQKVDTGTFAEDYYESTVTAAQLFKMYLRPAIGNAVRRAFAKRQSDEVNDQRDAIAKEIEITVHEAIKAVATQSKHPPVVLLSDLNVSKIGFPKSMMELNEKLANKKTERLVEDEEQKKVMSQIETEKKRKQLEQAKAETVESDIVVMSRAMKENPDYLKYKELELRELALQKGPEVAKGLGAGGGTIVFGREGLGMFLGNPPAPK